MKRSVFVLIFISISFSLVFQNCSDVQFGKQKVGSSSSGIGEGGDALDSNTLDNPNQTDTGGDTHLPPTCSEITLSEEQVLGNCLFLFDTFDRAEIVGDPADPNNPFNWVSIIDDAKRDDYENIHATIYQNGEYGFGQARHEEHAVFVTGRPGASVHDVYFISKPLNMAAYNRMRIDFSYLPVRLERWSWDGDEGLEHIRIEVCSGSLNECGIKSGGRFDDGINGSAWKPVFLQPGFADNNGAGFLGVLESGANNTGRNHTNKSWLEGSSGYLDLNDTSVIIDKSAVVFRVAIKMDEGFTQNSSGDPIRSSELEDAMGLDYVRVLASKLLAD